MSAQEQSWLCLVYHGLLPAPVSRGGGPEWFGVPAATFARQLDLLRAAGYQGCSLAEATAHGARRVAITFDDGVASDYERAFPTLVERQMTATFFVITDRVGSPGFVTWPQLREMREAGMSIESHTRTHPFLSELSPKALHDELVGAKGALDDALGQDTTQLALPGGDAPRGRLYGLIAEAGYHVVATSRWGRNGQAHGLVPRSIRRCTVAGDVSDLRFRRVLAGDWAIDLRRRLREVVLGNVRALLGPSRYASLRRRILERTRALPWEI